MRTGQPPPQLNDITIIGYFVSVGAQRQGWIY
jgi:hypothetical protein